MNKICIIFLIIIISLLFFYFINNSLKYKVIMYENFDNNQIPKIIIQTWKTKIRYCLRFSI